MRRDLSVIVPLFDNERHIEQALHSVLAGADGLLEVIVVDDGSSDRGPEIARGFADPVRVVSQHNQGVGAARNAGLRSARGDLIGFLDADDLWVAGIPDPRRGALQHPDVDAVLGRVQPVFGEPPAAYGEPLTGVQLGALLAPRELLLEHGGFNAGLRFSEDLDLILRMREAGVRIAMIPDVTVHYRQHDQSATRDREADRQGIVRVIQASLARRSGA